MGYPQPNSSKERVGGSGGLARAGHPHRLRAWLASDTAPVRAPFAERSPGQKKGRREQRPRKDRKPDREPDPDRKPPVRASQPPA